MYTIGTSSLKLLREKIKATHAAAYSALDNRLLAFVGTETDRAGTLCAPYSAFFQLSSDKTQVRLWIPEDSHDIGNLWTTTPDRWTTLANDSPFNEAFITEWLKPAGGLANGLYATQRGNFADMGLAYKHPGLTYYAKDTKEIYVCDDGYTWQPVNLNAADRYPMGSIIIYPEQFDLTDVMKPNWMLCDGHIMTDEEKQKYHIFAELIKGKFGAADEYKLPTQNNAIIRVGA